MIDRKTFWISILLIFAMVAAALWRLSLSSDWHHVPAEGPGNSRMIPPFMLFVPPLGALFVMALILALNWRFGPEQTSPKEAVESWWRRQSLARKRTAPDTGLNTVIATLTLSLLRCRTTSSGSSACAA